MARGMAWAPIHDGWAPRTLECHGWAKQGMEIVGDIGGWMEWVRDVVVWVHKMCRRWTRWRKEKEVLQVGERWLRRGKDSMTIET